MESDLGKTYCFGDYVLEPSEHRLTRNGEEIPLRPKTFEVLAFLVQHHNHRVTKEELFSAIWPETFVTEKVLRHSIWEIRGVLNNQGDKVEWIKTFPKVGYQFVGNVKQMRADALEVKSRLRSSVIAALCCSLVVFALWHFGLLLPKAPTGEADIHSIAILPFTSVTEDEESQSLAFGLATHVSSSLSGIEGLRVKTAAALTRYKGREIDPQTVSGEQNVSFVLMGTVELSGDTLAVAVNLIDGRSNSSPWGDSYNAKRNGIFAIQEDVVRQVAGALGLRLREDEVQRLVRSGTSNREAFDAYCIGVHRYRSWISGRIKLALDGSIESFQSAVELDPNYQEAYEALASSYFGRARNVSQSYEDYGKAKEYLKKVIEVDDSTAIAHQARARLHWQYDRKWREAEKEYRRAAELDPTLETDSFFLEWMCRLEKVKTRTEKLEDTSDPRSPHQLVRFGNLWLWSREYDRAIERASKALAFEPELPAAHFVLSQAYQQLGKTDKAFKLLEGEERINDTPEAERAAIAEIFQETGLLGVQRWLFDHRWRNRFRKPASFAATYAKLGEYDNALEWLGKLWEQPLFGMDSSPACFYWDPLRSDPRFEELLRKQNLPEEAIQKHLALPTN